MLIICCSEEKTPQIPFEGSGWGRWMVQFQVSQQLIPNTGCSNRERSCQWSSDSWYNKVAVAGCWYVEYLSESLMRWLVDCRNDGDFILVCRLSEFMNDCTERIIILKTVHQRILNRCFACSVSPEYMKQYNVIFDVKNLLLILWVSEWAELNVTLDS